MGIRELLLPWDTIFFDLFERQAGLLTEAAGQRVVLTENFTDIKEKRQAIEKLEQLEIATDNCEDVANVLSDIAIHHS